MAASGLLRFAEDVWLDSAPVRFLGMRLTANMTVLRLGDGSLLLHSPVAITPDRRTAVEALGLIGHLYAPNLFHHLSIGDWASAFPSATIHAPAGLAQKRRDLRVDRVHCSAPEPAFAGVIDEVRINGFRLEESVLFHRPSRTLIVADLLHNIGQPQHRWTRFYTQMMGFYDRIALSRMIRWTAFTDKAAARRSIDELLSLPFERVIVGHGKPVSVGGRGALAASYEGLPPAPRSTG